LEFFDPSSFLWIVFGVILGVSMAIDLGAIGKIKQVIQKTKADEQAAEQVPAFSHALAWTIIWIGLAVAFGGIIFLAMGYDKGVEFVTGYALEKSLSVDNMFVFLLVFSSLGIPYAHQHKVLSVGIISAIAMRIAIILAFITVLESIHWIIYVFGAFLIFTAIRMLVQKKEKKIELEKNIAVKILRKIVPLHLNLVGNKFLVRIEGVLYATPLLVALAIIEMADLVFAIDSIPAIMAITADPFIVISSNIFAMLGLRSLYFLLAGSLAKFYYLKPALVALLFYVGLKIMISEIYKIPVEISLVIVGTILGIAILLSMHKTRNGQHIIEK
jgi:tellurite resistance protein TerC